MNQLNLVYVSNRKDWRKWLKKNHASENEIWLVYYKKHTGKDRVPYEDAVEEALCFGWIDSIVRRIDEDRFAQKFTPRKESSKWSESNRKRIAKLEAQGILAEAGLRSVQVAKESGKWYETIEIPKTEHIGTEFELELNKNPKAKNFFDNLAPSYKKQYVGWISSAKRDETRRKRIKEAIGLLNGSKKLGLK
jgi:uncharacterized protein YdeI (YjbR/CyaY-like superfamily)